MQPQARCPRRARWQVPSSGRSFLPAVPDFDYMRSRSDKPRLFLPTSASSLNTRKTPASKATLSRAPPHRPVHPPRLYSSPGRPSSWAWCRCTACPSSPRFDILVPLPLGCGGCTSQCCQRLWTLLRRRGCAIGGPWGRTWGGR